MLYLDGISLSKFKDELNDFLPGRKISKVSQYDKNSLGIFFNKLCLYFSVNPSLPLVFITDNKSEAPFSQLPFCLSLKKYINGAQLISISQFGSDRILSFEFDRLNELGENIISYFVIEIMGKHSNLFLLDKNMKIIDALKKFSLEENTTRIVLPGFTYQRPHHGEKLLPTSVDESFFNLNIHSPKELLDKVEGFGKYFANEVSESYAKFKSLISNKTQPTIYFENNIIKMGSVVPLSIYSHLKSEQFNTINEMINYYMENTISSEQINNLKSILNKAISTELKRNIKITEFLDEDIINESDYEKYKQLGDILAANLYSLKRNQRTFKAFDFYNDKEIELVLNPDIDPSENLNNYYKKYTKSKKKYEFSIERKELILKEILYLESILSSIENSLELDNLKTIEEELIEHHYIKPDNSKKQKKKQKSSIELKSFNLEDGVKIYVGRNNKENDYISFKIADKTDIWLHAKNIPGSHVIIKRDNVNITISEEIILAAAAIAAFYSKGKNENSVLVDYTQKRYLNKPSGSKPGFVTYVNEKTVSVKPKGDL